MTAKGSAKSALKRVFGGTALTACALLCGCAGLQQQGGFDSSGAAGGDAPESTLALAVHPEFSPDDGADAATPKDLENMEHFVGVFARIFSADFPSRLQERGVQVHDPGVGIPLLRIRATGYRQDCHGEQSCEPEVRIDGTLLDSSGARVWWFSQWLTPAQMNQARYDTFYKRLLDRMVKEQAIAPG